MSSSPGLDALLRPVYRMFAWTFLVVGTLFFLFLNGTIDTLNGVGGIFGFPDAPHLAHRFWLGLAVAYMAVVTSLAWLISEAPSERRILMPPLAIGKAVSSGTCLLFLIFERPYFIYLANFLVDGGIALGAWWTWRLTRPLEAGAAGVRAQGGAALSEGSRRILGAVGDAFLPPGGAFAQGADAIGLAQKVESHIAQAFPLGLPAMAALLHWIDLQPILFHLTPHRLHTLPLEERVRILEAMERSALLARRQTAVTLKLFLGLHAYRDSAVARQVGFDRSYLDAKIRAAADRRKAGGKGPFPVPQAPPGPGGR